MKKLMLLSIVCLCMSVPNSAISASASNPYAWTGNINAFLGMKSLDEDDWEPIEEQDEFGIRVDFKQEGWPVSMAIDYFVSSEEDTGLYYLPGYGTFRATLEGETSELCFGVRKIWDYFPTVRPFIGGGIALVNAEAEVRSLGIRVYEDDDAIGIWVGGGIYWTLTKHFNLGFSLRWSKAEVTIYGVDSEAGGGHAGLLIGYHW